jgi:hypothetical protein
MNNKAKKMVRFGLLAGLLALAAQPASAALKIIPVFIGGEPPSGSMIAGGGNLQEIFQVAAQAWENVFKRGGGNWTLRIEYGWTNDGGFAYERSVAFGGNPIRMTQSRVFFNNAPTLEEGVLGWFADATPTDNSEYGQYTDYRANVEGGFLNYGRVFSEATGDAANRVDLLTVAMHEIGHSLGLDRDYSGFANQFKFAGMLFTINHGPHLGGSFGNVLPLMVPDPTAGWRQLISGDDALLLAQISSFDKPDLDAPNP